MKSKSLDYSTELVVRQVFNRIQNVIGNIVKLKMCKNVI